MTVWTRILLGLAVPIAVLTAVSTVLAAGTPAATPGPGYTATAVSSYSLKNRSAMGLNSEGHVTGQNSNARLFLYDGTTHVLGRPSGATWAVGQGISDIDVIAATAQRGSVRTAYAVTYANGHTTWTALAGTHGHTESEAQAILPDGSGIVGELCATGDPACSHTGTSGLAVIWWHARGRWQAPQILPVGKEPFSSAALGVARNGTTIVVAGSVTQDGTSSAVVWLLPAHRVFTLRGIGQYTLTRAVAIAHGPGNTFYIAGTVEKPGVGQGQPARWTLTCITTTCKQTHVQMLPTIGETFAVNGHGAVIGYDRTIVDAGEDFIWQNGKESPIPATGYAINNAGQIAGWRLIPPESRRYQAVLLTPSS